VEAPTILIVDDHAPTARSLATVLRAAGYDTLLAHRGHEALELATQFRPAGAVLDIHLPDLNGLVLVMKLRALLGSDVPLIVLSGDTSMETIKSLPHVGATYFLSKPVSGAKVVEVVRRWLPLADDDRSEMVRLEPA
jgi:DNA-binding response OmpR family regulator